MGDRELETLLRYLLKFDRRELEDCLALASDDVYLTTTQVKHIFTTLRRAGLYETDMDAVVSTLARYTSAEISSGFRLSSMS